MLARIGVGKVITLTNTYDHRIIGGAESGEFLRWIHHLLLGEDGFYDDVFQSLAVPYEPARLEHRHRRARRRGREGREGRPRPPARSTCTGSAATSSRTSTRSGGASPRTHPELDILHYGLTIWDLEREFPVSTLGGGSLDQRLLPLRDDPRHPARRVRRARSASSTCTSRSPTRRSGSSATSRAPSADVSTEDQRRILERLNAAEAFEAFLQRKYLGQKRFSLEGAESLIPMLDALLEHAPPTTA